MVELAHSASELVRRAIRSWWTRVAGVLAVAAYLLEHLAPSVHVSKRLWLWIVAVGAALSVIEAYHRTRMERDAAHARDVREDHRQELQHRLQALLNDIEGDRYCDYEDAFGARQTHREAFRAHYEQLAKSLDRWDGAVQRIAKARDVLMDELIAEVEKAELDSNFDHNAILHELHGLIIRDAENDRLARPGTEIGGWVTKGPVPRSPSEPTEMWTVTLGQRHVAKMPATGNPGDRETVVAAARTPIEAIWRAVESGERAAEIAPSKLALVGLRQPVIDDLREWLKVSGIRVARGCSICRKNEGWADPKPPLRQRVADMVLAFRQIFR